MEQSQLNAIQNLDQLILSIDESLYQEVKDAIGQQKLVNKLQGNLPGVVGPIEQLSIDVNNLNTSIETAYTEIDQLKQVIAELISAMCMSATDMSSQGNNLFNNLARIKSQNPGLPNVY
jgi:SMC interacting uncharacterized protein involved in chromosome segregation